MSEGRPGLESGVAGLECDGIPFENLNVNKLSAFIEQLVRALIVMLLSYIFPNQTPTKVVLKVE